MNMLVSSSLTKFMRAKLENLFIILCASHNHIPYQPPHFLSMDFIHRMLPMLGSWMLDDLIGMAHDYVDAYSIRYPKFERLDFIVRAVKGHIVTWDTCLVHEC